MGFAWVPQIGLIVLFKFDFFFVLQTLFYHQPATSKKANIKKFLDLCIRSQTTQPDPHPAPQSALHNHHNSRTSNIPIITLWCLCKSKSTNRIIQILSEKTNNALSKIGQLSCAFKKFERKTEKQIHTHTNKPSLSSDSQHLRASGTSFDSISSTVGL